MGYADHGTSQLPKKEGVSPKSKPMNVAKSRQQQKQKGWAKQQRYQQNQRSNANTSGSGRAVTPLGKVAEAARKDQRTGGKAITNGHNAGRSQVRTGRQQAGRNNGVRQTNAAWADSRKGSAIRDGGGGGTGPNGNGALVTYTDNGFASKGKRYSTMAEYNRAFGRTKSQPIARGTQWYGNAVHEIETISRGTRNLRVGGRTYLGPIEFFFSVDDSTNLAAGCRASNGLFAVSPEAIGGQFQLYADMYTQFRVTRMKFIYVPSVPTTEEGQLLFYFVSDISRRFMKTGSEEIMHAANSEFFVATPVYEECSLEIDPAKTMAKYFDDTNGTFYNKMQGIFVCESATGLTPNIGDNTQFTYGNLFVELELVYTSPALDYLIEQVVTGSGVFRTVPLTHCDINTPVLATSPGAPHDNMEMSSITNVNDIETTLVYYGTIYARRLIEPLVGTEEAVWKTSIDPITVSPIAGTNVFMRCAQDPNDLDQFTFAFFESLEAASTFTTVAGNFINTPRMWIWGADIDSPDVVNFNYYFRYRSVGLITDGGS